MHRIIFLIALLLLITNEGYTQNFPDYGERSFVVYNDSARSQFFSATGSDGAVNPGEYIIGPGDILFISISGLEEQAFTIPVDHEANIYIPKVGGLMLKDNTLADSKEKIINAINRFYKNVDVFITLAEYKKIKVALIGNVVKPASFILPGNARLLDLITVSNGLNSTADYRNILISNVNKPGSKFDILAFMRLGDRENNPLLKEGDVVFVNKADRTISITGMIKYPGSYEYIEGEKCKDLINIAGGLLNKARTDSIEIVRFDKSGKIQVSHYYSFDSILLDDVILMPQDHIMIREKPDYLIDRYIQLTGFVKYPGFYKIIKNETTLYKIIQEAGGFREEAALSDASVTRKTGSSVYDPEFERLKLIPRDEMTDDEYDYLKAKSRQRVGKVVVDFAELFEKNNFKEDILLVDGDVIDVPKEKNYVIMLGQVVSPGNIIFDSSYNYEDYINLAGGFGWRALEGEVRVIKANTGEWIYADEVEKIEPGDAIWIPEDPPGPKFWEVFTISLNVLGQVATVVAAIAAVIIASR